MSIKTIVITFDFHSEVRLLAFNMRVQFTINRLNILQMLVIVALLIFLYKTAPFDRETQATGGQAAIVHAPRNYVTEARKIEPVQNAQSSNNNVNNNNNNNRYDNVNNGNLDDELQRILNLDLDPELYNILDVEQVSGALIHYITTKTYDCKDVARMGDEKDGGWTICMDVNINPQSCMVYSVGIADNWSFDEAMAAYGCKVFSFDPTINREDHQHSERVWFYNLGLWHEDIEDMPFTKHLSGNKTELQHWKSRTLESIEKILHHENAIIDVLKIDIEGSEWRVFPQIADSGVMKNVKQIVFEMHTAPVLGAKRLWETYVGTRRMMENSGFKLWFVRPNQAIKKELDYGKYAGNHKCCLDMAFLNTNFVN